MGKSWSYHNVFPYQRRGTQSLFFGFIKRSVDHLFSVDLCNLQQWVLIPKMKIKQAIKYSGSTHMHMSHENGYKLKIRLWGKMKWRNRSPKWRWLWCSCWWQLTQKARSNKRLLFDGWRGWENCFLYQRHGSLFFFCLIKRSGSHLFSVHLWYLQKSPDAKDED